MCCFCFDVLFDFCFCCLLFVVVVFVFLRLVAQGVANANNKACERRREKGTKQEGRDAIFLSKINCDRRHFLEAMQEGVARVGKGAEQPFADFFIHDKNGQHPKAHGGVLGFWDFHAEGGVETGNVGQDHGQEELDDQRDEDHVIVGDTLPLQNRGFLGLAKEDEKHLSPDNSQEEGGLGFSEHVNAELAAFIEVGRVSSELGVGSAPLREPSLLIRADLGFVGTVLGASIW